MNRIDSVFRKLKRQKRKALIAYVTGGFPSFPAMDRAVRDLEAGGVDVLEVGVPFSDPIADGPVIQNASHAALQKGVTPAALLKWAARFRRRSSTPVVFMTYLNPVYRMGFENFASRAARSGVDGVIVPDLILEEAAPLRKALRGRGLDLIFLAAPTTPPARRKALARNTRGFLYAVSVAGVTGARKELPAETYGFLKDLKKVSAAPVAVGFGVSGPEMARRLASVTDGVIVGSAVVRRIGERRPLYPFVKSLRNALDG